MTNSTHITSQIGGVSSAPIHAAQPASQDRSWRANQTPDIPKSGVRTVEVKLTFSETRDLREALLTASSALAPTARKDDVIQYALAKELLASGILNLAPDLAQAARLMKRDAIDFVYADGLPSGAITGALMARVLGAATGDVFNYQSQNNGNLLQRLEPKDDGAKNSQSTRGEHAPHTDDALIPEACRVQKLSLYGVINPLGTLTYYAPIADVEARLSDIDLALLSEPHWSVKAPASFGWADEVWSPPRALLGQDWLGRTTIAWPSYNTVQVDPMDPRPAAAVAALLDAVMAVRIGRPVDSGCWLSLNNLRGVHMRGAVPVGRRLLYRTYARDSLAGLRKATGQRGPVFDARKIVGL